MHAISKLMAIIMHCLSIGYTTRCRSLRDLHYRGPQAWGSVRSVETELRCVTGLYHGACGHGNVQQHSLSVATTTFILQQTAKQHFLEVE